MDSFETYTINSLMKKKIFETNFIMSRALFWVVQPKQKKNNDFSSDFVVMEIFLARKFFSKVFFQFFFKIFLQIFFFNIFFITFFFHNFFYYIFFQVFFIDFFFTKFFFKHIIQLCFTAVLSSLRTIYIYTNFCLKVYIY